MAYLPIEHYALIGNMRTAALVGTHGSIDWLCLPRFDSPSVFAALLDDRRGGRFRIATDGEGATSKQIYWPDTNVLVTRFYTADGVGEIQDFMPILGPLARHIRDREAPHRAHDPGCDWLVRRVRVVRGTLRFHMRCEPAFNYARDPHEVQLDPAGAIFRTPSLSLALTSPVPLQRDGTAAIASFELTEGDNVSFVLRALEHDIVGRAFATEETELLFQETVAFWNRWLARCTYRGRWREVVHRSALVLKLLTYEPTGAIVAAPTCSLPEFIGGTRNWDYRYTWLRDAAFTIYALLRIGLTEEAKGFMRWVDARCHEADSDAGLQIMYGIDGRHQLTEETLDHFEGYRGSAPVRVGNKAHEQLQLDTYGELLDAVYLYNKYVEPISNDMWGHLRDLLSYVCDHWEEPDEGIWEVRGGRQHFVSSKLMCWVALDRGLRLATKRSLPVDYATWLAARDAVYERIMRDGWSTSRQAFVQAFGSERLDASTLLMPLVLFIAPGDPNMISTLETIRQPITRGGLVSDSLVYRYNTQKVFDGVGGEEGTFNMCTFWLVEALTRASISRPAYLSEARLLFERMLGYANHVGLFSEQTGPRGEALGNYPQAFTHLSLISAAFNLDRALGADRS